MKILFGVRDGQECKRAAHCIKKLFDSAEHELTLLHVSSDVIMYAHVGVVDYGMIEEVDRERYSALLNDFMKIFEGGKIKTKILIKEGDPIDCVLEAAKDFDLLVIGESESNVFTKLFGSHKNTLVNASPIPILIAK